MGVILFKEKSTMRPNNEFIFNDENLFFAIRIQFLFDTVSRLLCFNGIPENGKDRFQVIFEWNSRWMKWKYHKNIKSLI